MIIAESFIATLSWLKPAAAAAKKSTVGGFVSRSHRARGLAAVCRGALLPLGMALAGFALAGAPEVTPGGLPSYEYPIALPPGVGNVVPQIAARYTAARSGGVLGLGWEITGADTVTRCPTTHRTDGARRGVEGNQFDKLCWGGQRLISVNSAGSSPIVGRNLVDASGRATGAFQEFRTEHDGFDRVRAYGYAVGSDADSGPAYLKVWTKKGLILEYGNSPQSNTQSNALVVNISTAKQPRQFAQQWLLSRVSDKFGNSLDYKYTQRSLNWGSNNSAGQEVALTELQYAGNKVIFTYVDKGITSPQDREEAYELGVKRVSAYRLSQLTTYTNSPNTSVTGPAAAAVAVRTIKFGFDNGPTTKRSRLTSITECAGGPASTNCLPVTSYEYTPGANEVYQASSSFNLGTTQLWFADTGTYSEAVDFNGDGRADILIWANDPSLNKLYLSNGDGSFTQAATFNLAGQQLGHGNGCFSVAFQDFNGDGLVDIFRHAAPAGSTGKTSSQMGAPFDGPCPGGSPSIIFFNNGDGSFTGQNVTGVALNIGQDTVPTAPSGYHNVRPGHHFTFIDFDGDGLMDIVTHDAAGGTIPIPHGSDPFQPIVGCPSGMTCTRAFKGNGSGGFTEVPTNLAGVNTYWNVGVNKLGEGTTDLNADGLKDLRLPDNYEVNVPATQRYSDSKLVLVSRGDGNFDILSNQNHCISYGRMKVLDFNGDNREDCVAEGGSANGHSLFVADVASANGVSTTSLVGNFSFPGPLEATTLDANGDGRDDMLVGANSWTNAAQLWISNGDGTFYNSSLWAQGALLFNDYYGRVAAPLIADFTGRGQTEILRRLTGTYGNPTDNILLLKSSAPEQPDLLKRITTSTGLRYDFSYVNIANPSTPSSAVATRYVMDLGTSNKATVPYSDVVLPTFVVSIITYDTGVGSQRLSTDYQYRGMKQDALIGDVITFREVLKQQRAADGGLVTTRSLYEHQHPYERRLLEQSVHAGGIDSLNVANYLKRTRHLDCDAFVGTSAMQTAAASNLRCVSTGPLRKLFTLKATAESKDLDGSSRPTEVSTTLMGNYGVPEQVSLAVTAPVGATTFTEVQTDTFLTPVTACSAIDTCEWQVALRSQSTRRRMANDTESSTTAGSAPRATAVSGSALAPINPGVLAAILQLLLDD